MKNIFADMLKISGVLYFLHCFTLLISRSGSFCRTIESLYEELVVEGILVRPNKVSVSDYIGEYSYLGTTLRQANIEPMPSLSDVRRVITEFCILPLGVSYISFLLFVDSSLFFFLSLDKIAST